MTLPLPEWRAALVEKMARAIATNEDCCRVSIIPCTKRCECYTKATAALSIALPEIFEQASDDEVRVAISIFDGTDATFHFKFKAAIDNLLSHRRSLASPLKNDEKADG